jgi:drug/metabolite transporter (DMT)-like permease
MVIKIGLVGLPPFLSAGLRFVLAAAVLFAVVGLKKRKLALDRDGKIAVWSCGLLSFTYGYAATYWAEQYIASGLTAILWCTLPLEVALLSRFWTRSETLGPRKILGILLGIGGTAALFWTDNAFASSQAVGMVVALSAVLSAAVNAVSVKKYGRGVDVFVMNAYGMAIGAACLLLLSLCVESYGAVVWSRSNVSAIVYLALAGTVVTFTSYYHLLKLLDATKVSTVSLIYPIIALLIGRAYGGEKIGAGSLAAIAAVLAGVGFALFARPKRQV